RPDAPLSHSAHISLCHRHYAPHLCLPSFPTRRSSDLEQVLALATENDHVDAEAVLLPDTALHTVAWLEALEDACRKPVLTANQVDRKSTRLNSSHRTMSYAVFCLKKKN